MGKNKRQKHLSHGKKKQKPHRLTRPAGVSKPSTTTKPKPSRNAKIQDSKPILPFALHEKILLIGEGDLSFARSLVTNHRCSDLTATVYEDKAELFSKYPTAEDNAAAIEELGGVVRYEVNAMKMKHWVRKVGKDREGVIDRIFFNFPHVGGKTKDVNKQVRYNQELLVAFFKNSIPSLSPKQGSSITVTLFEGEPYTLWNIRDLARHSGLEVNQSFRFQASAYPGYKHSRTFGVVKKKDGTEGVGWKGEERAARSFEFVRRGEGVVMGVGKGKKKESSDESEGGEEIDQDVDEESEDEDLDDNKIETDTEEDLSNDEDGS